MDFSVDRFSFHRPSALVLRNVIHIPGVFNAYDPLFFAYNPSVESLLPTDIKYIADSRNQWSYVSPYDSPCKELFDQYSRIQILCHPYSWTEAGYDTLGNLRMLLQEAKEERIDTMCSETVYIKEYRNEL